ncbi:hypothetical protein Bhyg_00977 [Pseudolycoriella hygida]|uniref:Single domain-containing protein n=1 Tax=Pseudolycoriella hygida TaxID=35572 RepID=A0A9Q0N8J5_9DIPT|nr:hypothetical protein Bhyg_00977 [Pseudolycoriella hygida]
MFTKITTVILLFSFASVAFCATAIGPPSVHPDHPGKCYDFKTKKAHSPGEVFTVNKCTRVTCNNDLSFAYATCGSIAASPPCRVVDGNLKLPYPKCCPTVKCNK